MASIIYDTNIQHPDTFSFISGNTNLTDYLNAVNQSVRLILSTSPGELFGDPNYGSRLKEYLYDYVDESFVNIIKLEIADSLTKWEPRITVRPDMISLDYEGTTVVVTIDYILKYTDYKNTYQYITKVREES